MVKCGHPGRKRAGRAGLLKLEHLGCKPVPIDSLRPVELGEQLDDGGCVVAVPAHAEPKLHGPFTVDSGDGGGV